MSLSILGLLIATAEAVPLSSVPAGGLVITEIMHDPSVVADYRGEYIEIYNDHTDPIDINGLQLDSGEAGSTVNQSITIPVGGRAVLAANANSANNGGNTNVDFQYSYNGFKLGKNDTVTISDGTTTFDSVTYSTSSHPIQTGAALILDTDTRTASANDTSSNWCTSGNVFGSGDTGTPGSLNDGCSSVADLNVGDLVITEIMWNPTFVSDFRGEWIEVYNASSASLNLNGLVITSSNNTGHTISSDVVVSPGGRSLLNVRASSSTNGGTNGDYTYSYGQVSFTKTDSVGLEASGVTIDSVSYGFSSHSLENGKSINLAPGILTASGNDTSSNWCTGSTTYGDGDIGTPGSVNDTCGNVDADGDGFNADVDCDDTNSAITVTTYYLDNDSDTFGSSSSGTTTGCTVPSGYSELNTDCNDGNSNVNPNASEVCDGVDNDCDTLVDDADTVASGQTTYYLDSDDDTYGDDTGTCSDGSSTTPETCVGAGETWTYTNTVDACDQPTDASSDGFSHVLIDGDCDDADSGINPGVTESGAFFNNGVDENCDGVDNVGGDNDGDGFLDTVDCNDGDASINPGADEVCDGVDNDCDGLIDDDDSPIDPLTWFVDGDSDGFGGSTTTTACNQPSGAFSTQQDCDDGNAGIFPGATEVTADGIDQDCNSGDICYQDGDDDGFRTDLTVSSADLDCTDSGEGESADPNTDCDDSNATVNPSATEICDDLDNDCDSDIDDNDSSVDASQGGTTYFFDNDGDLYGDAGNTILSCDRPSGYVDLGTDCDDNQSLLKPLDKDGDGVDMCNNDCDDTDEFSFPGAAENESTTDCMTDADEDGFGDGTAPTDPNGFEADGVAGTDCDDATASVNPVATEICDSIDNDCDSLIDDADTGVSGQTTYYADVDSDTFGDDNSSQVSCSAPANHVTINGDCDDTDGTINPNATEVCDSVDNDCDTLIDDDDTGVSGQTTYFTDGDLDGFGGSSTVSACSQPANTTVSSTDCDDSNGAINPSATEVCDSVDNDCDTDIDDADSSIDTSTQTTFFADTDSDTFGDSTSTQLACSAAGSFTATVGGDCDDSNTAINPNATEVCDTVDNDCDSLIDEDGGTTTYYLDNDGDTYGQTSETTTACSVPAGYAELDGDCDDTVGTGTSFNPGASETCLDGVDNDCDGTDSLSSCEGGIAGDDLTITGASTGDRLGQAISYAGNITGTTARDFVLGSRLTSSEDGAVYIFDGSASFSGTSSVSTATTITGATGERFGFSVAGGTNLLGGITSDFNGDGNDDLLVGAPNADVGGSAIGSAYMFYGPISGNTTSSAASAVFTGQFGQDGSNPSNHNAVNTGYAVAFVGDVNNDGYADITIGDPSKKNSGSTNGEAYLVFGRGDTFDGGGVQLTGQYEGTNSLNEASWRAQFGREILSVGTGREQMGAALDAIGDVNGDGIDDLAVGAYRWDSSSGNANLNNGGVFVWYGGTTLTANATLTVSHETAGSGDNTSDVTIVGANSGDQIGRSIAGAGDFDGDGVNDIVIGSEHANSNAGLIMIVDGNGNTIAQFTGENAGDGSGRWVSGLGNIDGDAENSSDILVGSKYADANGSESGAAYIILGGSSVSGTNSLSSAEVFLTGANAGNRTGGNVSAVDDLDSDGVSEILIGAELSNSEQGAVHFIYSNTFQ